MSSWHPGAESWHLIGFLLEGRACEIPGARERPIQPIHSRSRSAGRRALFLSMATERFAAVGNYIKLTKDSAAGTAPGEFAIITGRFVSDEKAADNRTTLAIYSSQSTFDKMKAGIRKQDNSACNFAEYIERNARTVLKDCNNTRLSNVVGAGDIWKDFISQTTRRLHAADFEKRSPCAGSPP